MDELVVLIILEKGVKNLDHFALFRLQLLLKESRQVHFPDETNSLGVLLVCGRKVGDVGYLSDFGFCEVTDGEESLAELLLGELAKEIALVFVRVGSLEYSPLGQPIDNDLLPFTVQQRSPTAIMACSHHVGP